MQKITTQKGNGLAAPHDQPAKTITKRTVDFIVTATYRAGFCWPGLVVVLQAALLALVEVLQ